MGHTDWQQSTGVCCVFALSLSDYSKECIFFIEHNFQKWNLWTWIIKDQILNSTCLIYTCHVHDKGKPLYYTTVIHSALFRSRSPILCIDFSCQMEASDFCTWGHLMSSSVCSYLLNVASGLADVQRHPKHQTCLW